MPKNRNLGEFEILVLAALLRLRDDAYGSTIREEIEARTGRSVTVGALYATLSRMEDKLYITSRTGEATPQRGGRAKRYYDLTPLGREQLERSVTALNNMLEGVVPWRQTLEI
ncbi:MAG: PadR family transcriptional regulator [Pseudomonadota bacterium]